MKSPKIQAAILGIFFGACAVLAQAGDITPAEEAHWAKEAQESVRKMQKEAPAARQDARWAFLAELYRQVGALEKERRERMEQAVVAAAELKPLQETEARKECMFDAPSCQQARIEYMESAQYLRQVALAASIEQSKIILPELNGRITELREKIAAVESAIPELSRRPSND